MEPTESNNKTDNGTASSAAEPSSAPAASNDKAESKTSASAAKPDAVRKPAKPGVPPRAKSPGNGRGLGWLALLVALVALGFSLWQWQQRQAQQVQMQVLLEQVQAGGEQRLQQMNGRLEGVPQGDDWQSMQRLVAEMQRSQQAIGERLDILQGDGREDWKLAEAQYLLRLASLRLLAVQDVNAARELLGTVDGILKSMPDSGLYGVRQQLAQYQAQLEGLPELDRPGVFLRLAALRDQVERLVLLPVPEFDPDEVSTEEEYADRLQRRDRWDRVLMRLERYVRVDFQRGKVITPLLDEAEMQRVQRTLQLTMEQAQWAALRGETEVYQASLTQAEKMLSQYFELKNPQVQGMQKQLQELHEQAVSLNPPELAPLQQSLATYIQNRRSASAAKQSEAGDE
ncbi:uroporphyrinogen-III C-methyltransferase [Pseudomonas neustonica]|uniref:uroporphyrinogen-III C-methyltransferase n=1 Tax=Pseudomonas TaxID=286 RepID=UPI000C91624C|nr:uroporphyrinogen-III C-methyltransferase [Pseudomonas sp. 5Ae-yellow]MAB24687.1 heme biosynthesis operon protein HemX [Pseudomonadales bacterium]MBA6419781.1 uroporphyrinogen-III C-methyltransferase [Pseudomonas sp. 5Ae-yellow]